jgi:hypothetical protein
VRTSTKTLFSCTSLKRSCPGCVPAGAGRKQILGAAASAYQGDVRVSWLTNGFEQFSCSGLTDGIHFLSSPHSSRKRIRKFSARDVGHLCIETVSALAVNTSLEYTDIEIHDNESTENISSVNFLAALAALGPNTTLKTLRHHPKLDSFDIDQVKKLLSLLEELWT